MSNTLAEKKLAAKRSVILEGVIAGAIGATVVAIWFLIVDLVQARPFQVPAALGHWALPQSRAMGLPSWLLISVGNILAALAMGWFLWHSHPLLGRQLDHALSGRDGAV